jgi:beta-galactosidase
MDRRKFLLLGGLEVLGAIRPMMSAHADSTDINSERQFAFSTDGSQFLLNQKPFQIRSGEMHPARIPVEYWQHRIQMAKAMGMNTISVYVIWNHHERSDGVFDFSSENRDIGAFILLCHSEGMCVLLRPGPYVCGEWDLGGIPPYLLRYHDIKLRANSNVAPQYMAAVQRYIGQLADIVKPLMIASGGPILMLQIENEFGSFGQDPEYLEELRQLWISNGITGPFYTEDGLPQLREHHSSVKGGAIALSGGEATDIKAVRRDYPDVPAICGELYPGWLTHWGESSFQGTDVDVSATLQELMANNFSFNMYVIHGGTNFGFTAGANTDKEEYQPDITSYDYAAPITEQGVATPKYFRYRKLIGDALGISLPDVPKPVATLAPNHSGPMIAHPFASIWDNLPESISAERPQIFEALGQNSGLILYRKDLTKKITGDLSVPQLNDYGLVYVGDEYMGGFSRTSMPEHIANPHNIVGRGKALRLDVKHTHENSSLDILVEAMGHVNYGPKLVDRKGIVGAVHLQENGSQQEELTDWKMYRLPLDEQFVSGLKQGNTNGRKGGLFFKLALNLDHIGDTYIDMHRWIKGVVWVNGHNLGRYWRIGPQHRLYCPAPWLKVGQNEILIFDLHQVHAEAISFASTLM